MVVLCDVFLASFFLAYMESKLFFHFRARKFSSAAPSNGEGCGEGGCGGKGSGGCGRGPRIWSMYFARKRL
jgi:hypothetical protein